MDSRFYNILLFLFLLAAFFVGYFVHVQLYLAIAAAAVIVCFFVAMQLMSSSGIKERNIRIENHFSSVMRRGGLGYYRTDKDGRLLFYDDYCVNLGRLLSEDQSDWQSYLFPHLNEGYIDSLYKRIQEGEGLYQYQAESRTYSGRVVNLVHSLQFDYSLDGRPCGIVGTVSDVSMLKTMELSLNREAEFLQDVLDSVTDSVFISDFEGNFSKVNKSFAESVGISNPKSCVGSSIYNYFPPSVADSLLNDFKRVEKTGDVQIVNLPVASSRGKELRLEMRNSLLFDLDGKPEAVIGFARKLSTPVSGRTEFCCDPVLLETVSHELRTPIAGILGSLSILEGKDLPGESREFVRKSITSAERLKDVVNNYLSDLSGNVDFSERSQVNLAEVLNNVSELFVPVAADHGAYLDVLVDQNLPKTVLCNKRGITQSLVNLMNNAVSHFNADKLTLAVRCVDQQPDNHAKLFFYVECNTPLHWSEGSVFSEGLTLSAKKINAELVYKSGDRSELGFLLNVGCLDLNPELVSAIGKLRVLLAEDDISSQVFMRKKLEKWGHDVSTVNNGVDVLNSLREKSYDVVLMDVQMPEMDGVEAIRSIREAGGSYSEIPVVVMSAYGGEGEFAQMKELLIAGYVSKPVQSEALRKILDRIATNGVD